MKVVTEEELAIHNNVNDLWIVVNRFVYDVTNFLAHHPGTEKPFLHFAGKDATYGFNKAHPNIDILTVKEVIFVGEFARNVD